MWLWAVTHIAGLFHLINRDCSLITNACCPGSSVMFLGNMELMDTLAKAAALVH